MTASQADLAPRPRLADKVVLISGTGGPIGRAAARLFVAHGAAVVGCDLDANTAAATVKAVLADGGEMSSLAPIDLTVTDDVRSWVDCALEKHGRVDVLYNNAGRNYRLPFGQTTDNQLAFTIDNQFGLAWRTAQVIWPVFTRQGYGTIINTASISALVGAREIPYAAHGASNAATLALTRQLAAEGARIGVRVNAITPGLIAREEITRDWAERGRESQYGPIIERTARQFPGDPMDIAYAALYLASDESRYLNAANIVVDGGATALL